MVVFFGQGCPGLLNDANVLNTSSCSCLEHPRVWFLKRWIFSWIHASRPWKYGNDYYAFGISTDCNFFYYSFM